MSEKLISANDVLKYTVLAGEIRNQYMEVVPAYYVREAPTVDAVEVVRCKDCKWYKETYSGSVVCQAWFDWIYTNENDFCSYGERREGVEE